MKIITEPKVILLTQQQVIPIGLGDLLEDVDAKGWRSDAPTDADLIPEVAGRLCYLSYKKPRPGGSKAYLEHIKETANGSVLEHTQFGFLFCGVSRSLTHELVRHRAGFAYSMLSQRYVDESTAEYVIPPAIQKDTVAKQLWENAVKSSHKAYCILVDALLDLATKKRWPDLVSYERTEEFNKLPAEEKTAIRKEVRQAARSVLPNATETKIMVTGNARAWRHFLEMRCSRHADVEIRKLAYKVWLILKQKAVNLFSDYTEVQLEDGTFELTTPYRKV